MRNAGQRAVTAVAPDEGFIVLHEFRREIPRTRLLRPVLP
jgi:hypothetical protein